MGPITLCLTGTIVPATNMVHRREVSLRVADYVSALGFYLNHTGCNLVFAENSDYDMESNPEFQPILENHRLKVLRLPPHPDFSRGKGFQEFHLLDRVVDSGVLGDRFAKVTGRYRVQNINQILRKSAAPLQIDLHGKLKLALTGFFISDTEVYLNHFKGAYRDANDDSGRFIEHVIYDRIRRDKEVYGRTALLPRNPKYRGVPGSHGGSLDRHPVKMVVRGWERTLNRSLGIPRFLIEY